MLSEEEFRYKYLQQPITFLTEENLDKLETHCRKAAKFERGFEHKVVLELLDRYYQYQKELKDKNNRITKLQKENEEKDKQIDLIIEEYEYNARINFKNFCEDELRKDSCIQDCKLCAKHYFKKLSKEKA